MTMLTSVTRFHVLAFFVLATITRKRVPSLPSLAPSPDMACEVMR